MYMLYAAAASSESLNCKTSIIRHLANLTQKLDYRLIAVISLHM